MIFAKRYLEARAGGYADRLHLHPGDWRRTADELAGEIERLKAELAAAPLAWTREKPTEPGLYLVRSQDAQWFDVYSTPPVGDLCGLEWAGPIPIPGEPEGGA